MPPSKRPFRFGVLASSAPSRAAWRDLARSVEDLGYATLLLPDHFTPQFAPLPALIAAAGATSRLRLGTFVLDNDFRHPAVLAKEAATVDLLTDGRLELGIGAGWNPADYAKTGQPFEPAGTRVNKLVETLDILYAYFAGGTVSYAGTHYQLDGLDAAPAPKQRPRPPLLLGANGPRMLRLAARRADILNFPDRPPVGVSTAGNPGLGITFPEQMAVVREAAGDRYDQLELSVLSITKVTDQVAEEIERLAALMQTTPQVVLDMPATFVGSVDGIVERMRAYRAQYDLSYFVIQSSAMQAMAPVVARLAGT